MLGTTWHSGLRKLSTAYIHQVIVCTISTKGLRSEGRITTDVRVLKVSHPFLEFRWPQATTDQVLLFLEVVPVFTYLSLRKWITRVLNVIDLYSPV